MKKTLNSEESDIPKIGAPAQRALAAAGLPVTAASLAFAGTILTAWVLTFPAAGLAAAVTYWVAALFLP